jgi:hypothetical protein
MPIAIRRRAGPRIRNGFPAEKGLLDLSILSISSDEASSSSGTAMSNIDHLEVPEAFQALDNLASDVLDTFGVFGRKWGGKVIIGDKERLLVVLSSIGDV